MKNNPIQLTDSVLPCAFAEPAVPVVFAANNAYVPMFSVCLQSLLEHCSGHNRYDIVLLHSDITPENQKTLLAMTAEINHVSLRFFDVTPLVADHTLKANAHISVETYFRFLIQDVLPNYDKVLYLDCDLVVGEDVAELFCEDVEGYMLAAVRDADFLGQIHGANEETATYVKTAFPMKDPDGYFQAGVILFNEAEMRKAHTLKEWLGFAAVPYKYNDQDVLNLHCEGRVKYLDMAWNVLTDCNRIRISQVISHAPQTVQKEYMQARLAPKIIHYAGFRKPWHDRREDFATRFWDVAGRTPYYEALLRLVEAEEKRGRHPVRWLLRRLFPVGSARWKWLMRLLHRS